MKHQPIREPEQIAQLMILGSYSALSLALIAETVLMGWELWAIPMILIGVALGWVVHVRQRMSPRQRMWVYTSLMMATFFFYGVHVTSTYDMAPLMMTVLIIYTVAGDRRLVTFCQLTYYFTLAWDLAQMARLGTEWDSLTISRTALHVALVFMAGWLSRFIIRQWQQIFHAGDERFAELDDTARRMNRFMANLSHELRTPVNAILGSTELLLEGELPDEARDQLGTVRGASLRMSSQIADLMDYSEIEAGSLTVNEEPYMLSSLFNDLVAELRPLIPPGVELVIDIDAETPAGLRSDVRKLKRILWHLIGNSLRYTKEGGVRVHVSAVRQDYGVNLCVEVTDTGAGMDESELERVLERFYQADAGKTVSAGGLGLGLPIANGFVAALGGFLMLDSKPGAGTTVRFSVPQQVTDWESCMSVADREEIQLGGYLNIRKFDNPFVREYYNSMILNVVQGLGTPMHRVDNVEDLKKLDEKLRLTHLFVGQEEYDSAADYLEELAGRMRVIVVTADERPLPPGSRAMRMPKPLYGFPIAAILNAGPQTPVTPRRLRCDGTRVLVVDDEPMNLTVAAGILRRYGMSVSAAHSGAEAIQMCAAQPFDLVLMDHMMPGMDGIEAMRRLRRQSETTHRSFPIVALTANALSSARERFRAEGFDGFLSKPIELPELERVLRSVLPASLLNEEGAEMLPAPPVPDAPAPEGFAALDAAGIDSAVGLRYCQDDAEFYRELLRQFAADEPDKRRSLDAARRAGRLADYAITVHALKSTAKTVGAEALSEAARNLEAAAGAGDAAAVDAAHPGLLDAYENAVRAIRDSLGDADEAPADEDDGILEFFPEGGDEA